MAGEHAGEYPAGHDAIAVVDFGGQYAHLIATKVRRLHVLAEIRQPDDPLEAFAPYKGIILSGSPSLSSQGEDSAYTKGIYDLEVPIAGFCFGHQEIAKHYGGKVIHGGREWGPAALHIVRDHPLFSGMGKVERVWMSHFDSVVALGPGFEELGYTALGEGGEGHRYAAIGSDTHRRYGFQFHPEVDDTEHGDEMISNFVLQICGCRPSWTMERYLEEQVERVRQQVGSQSVFLLASGGVDSTVAAKLFALAIGADRLHLLHVDNGLMRKDESRKVVDMLRSLGVGRHVHFVDASERFLEALRGVVAPEQKRRIIGDTFIQVFEHEARRLGIADHLLGQGTIYPDTIETGGTKRADTIKTHHNRVPIVEEMIAAGKVVEPLAELYKVEVRELGAQVGIPHELLWRHPFPGPGLGVRLLCSEGKDDRDGFETTEPAVAEVASRYGLATLVLPIRSVGVKADLRAYEHPVMLHGDVGWDRVMEAAGMIFRQVPGINRCVWNLSPALPPGAHAVAATVTRERLDLLREADAIVMDGLRRAGVYESVWQCPTVLVPLGFEPGPDAGAGAPGQPAPCEFVIVRPIHSERAMTATPARLPMELLDEWRRSILALPGVSGLAIDVSTKPPGTIEWE